MAEYIEREKTVKVLRDLSTRSGGVFGVIICSVAKAIEKIPAADVRPVVHGTWIPVMAHYTNGRVEQAREEAYSPLFKCSECGFDWISYDDINFCPKCGAMMEEIK